MDKLGKYKLDKAFSDGVDIRLDDAPDVVFTVRLPSQYNRAYTQALYSSMEWDLGEDGAIKTGGSLMATRYAQEDAFLEHCLMSMDGEPITEGFAKDYPEAVAELMSKAIDLSNDIQERVETSVKKSPASSNGNDSGQEKSGSTSTLKAAEG